LILHPLVGLRQSQAVKLPPTLTTSCFSRTGWISREGLSHVNACVKAVAAAPPTLTAFAPFSAPVYFGAFSRPLYLYIRFAQKKIKKKIKKKILGVANELSVANVERC